MKYSVINNHTEVLIGSYNPKVLNEYAILCVETSTEQQSRSLPGPELTGLAACPPRLPTASSSAHRLLEVAGCPDTAAALPWFFRCSSRGDRALPFHNQESPVFSWPMGRAEAFFKLALSLGKLFSCSKPQRVQTVAKLGKL